MIKLGLAAFYHDSAASIVIDGKVIAAVEEERFTGIKHDSSFPVNAIKWCLREANIVPEDVNEVYWYENPSIKNDRVTKIFKKHPLKAFWVRRKYKKQFKNYDISLLLKKEGLVNCSVKYCDHHHSHSSFAYYTSPYKHAAILSIDGVGEWETTTISLGVGDTVTKMYSIDFPNSLGMLYSTITAYLGFKPNEGEYKVMGLAPYGDPNRYFEKLEKVIEHKNEKYYLLQKYFTWEYTDQIMFSKNLYKLLELPPRLPEEVLNQDHKDLAASLQKLYEREFLKLVNHAKTLTNSENLCLSGGCAYNGVANYLSYKYFKSVYVPFAPSDAGSAIGACLDTHTKVSPYLGPEFSDWFLRVMFQKYSNKVRVFKLSDKKLVEKTAQLLTAQKIVAWFQGRMEFGARALGNRSILASPTDSQMREKLNFVIKKREGFRPFAPSVTSEQANKWFYLQEEVPYMNMVVKARTKRLPAATHIDGTCRVQTVRQEDNPLYHALLTEFGRLNGPPVLLNTSFNLKDETITMTPIQAIDRFLNSKIDYLVINNYLIQKL